MPINNNEIMRVVQQLSEQENLRITVKESAKGAVMAGSGALFGGIIGGPMGIAIGGSLGSLCAAWQGSGKFKSVVAVINEDMTAAQRDHLVTSIQRVIQDVRVEDVVMLTSLAMGNATVKQLIITELCRFIRDEMGMAIA